MWLSEAAPPWGTDNPVRDMPSASKVPAMCVGASIMYVIPRREVTRIQVNKSPTTTKKKKENTKDTIWLAPSRVCMSSTHEGGDLSGEKKSAKVGHFLPTVLGAVIYAK